MLAHSGTPRDANKYYDGFYICHGDYKQRMGITAYVDHIDGVFDALHKLAPVP